MRVTQARSTRNRIREPRHLPANTFSDNTLLRPCHRTTAMGKDPISYNRSCTLPYLEMLPSIPTRPPALVWP